VERAASARVERTRPSAAFDLDPGVEVDFAFALAVDRVERTPPSAAFDLDLGVEVDFAFALAVDLTNPSRPLPPHLQHHRGNIIVRRSTVGEDLLAVEDKIRRFGC